MKNNETTKKLKAFGEYLQRLSEELKFENYVKRYRKEERK